MNTPSCYGTHGSGDCSTCEYEEWCSQSGDPPLLSDSWRIIPIFEHFRNAYDLRVSIDESSRLSRLFAELIHELDTDNASLLWDFLATMSALSKRYPSQYRVIRARILNPSDTIEGLAERLGITRECVSQHLTAVAELIPEIRSTIMAPAKKLSRAKSTPFEIRCSGGRISILAGSASVVLTMPMDDANSKSVGKVVDGLNNMHWKRRDALLEELEK